MMLINVPGWGQAVQPVITSISVCSPAGLGGPGSCPTGSGDTHQLVLAPDGSGNAINTYNAGAAADEHSSVFAPGTLGANNDYVFFIASGAAGNPGIGDVVLSGGAGPNDHGQWAFHLPTADGYGSYLSGFGQVFRQASSEPNCPQVASASQQDQTFDLNYAAPGSVLPDPTGPAGSLLMIYEGTNTCVGSSGGPRAGSGTAYISTGVATSLDYGKTWPTYRGTAAFTFVAMPNVNTTQGPNAPMGAIGNRVCMGNDCNTPPPAAYGRYPALMPPITMASVMAAGQTLQGNMGDSQVSAFLDDVSGAPAPYVYIVHDYLPGNNGGNDLAVARGQLNGGAVPLSFSKWDGQAFNTPGINGAEAAFLPNGAFQNCGSTTQGRTGGSIVYVDATRQYVLLFTCRSENDPALGPGTGHPGAAWFYSTTTDLSDPTKWSTPQEIAGSWSEIDSSAGCPSYKGWYPTWMSPGTRPGHLSLTGHVFYLWGCETGAADGTAPGRQFSSRQFTITTSTPLPAPFPNSGEGLGSGGGSGSIQVAFPAGYGWTASTIANWIVITSGASGTGNGSVNFSVTPNAGGDRTANITVNGFSYTVEQAAASISGLAPAGSLAQIAAQGGWDFTFKAVNLGASSAVARFTFAGDQGNSLTMPLTFPQLDAVSPELAATLDRTIAPNAQMVMESTGPANTAVLTGSGEVATNGSISAFGTFSYPALGWNALVPLETRNAGKYILAFDNSGNLSTGVAVANLASASANIQLLIRDDTGAVIGSPVLALGGFGHTSFMLNDTSKGYPVTSNRRGTVEFDTPAGGQISVLGLRAYGASALTTLPVLVNGGSGGGNITHVAYNAGFTSTFYLLNPGAASASFTLNFYKEDGTPLLVPMTLPQSGTQTTTSALTETLAAGAMLVVETQANDSAASVVGSAQLTTAGSISGFEVFRWTTYNQEASVPLETRSPNSFLLVFDDTNGLTTGVALANLATTTANISVNLYDDAGNSLGTAAGISLPPKGHVSFMLPDATRYPVTAGKRGMIEFVAPSGGAVSAIGLRATGAGLLTTIPVLAR